MECGYEAILVGGCNIKFGVWSLKYLKNFPCLIAHIHYSHDAVIQVPPEKAVEILRAAGVTKALVSSSDDDGTQKLLKAAPDVYRTFTKALSA